jgi:purine-binding chemotaxis protein CheW
MTTSDEKQTSTIEWSDIHRRLEIEREAIERGFEPTPKEKKRILKDRAKSLARQPEKEEDPGKQLQVVEFLLAHERYAIETAYIREAYPLKELTPLPGTPPFVLGIINVRGQIFSLIDLKKFFELPEKGITDLNKVMIIHTDEMEFGILADAIIGVRPVPFNELQPSLPTLTGIRADYLKGVTKERIVVLDAKRILSDKKIVVHKDVEV